MSDRWTQRFAAEKGQPVTTKIYQVTEDARMLKSLSKREWSKLYTG